MRTAPGLVLQALWKLQADCTAVLQTRAGAWPLSWQTPSCCCCTSGHSRSQRCQLPHGSAACRYLCHCLLAIWLLG